MEEPAIEILNVSKVYKLYDKSIDRLKEVLSPTKKSYHRDFYALKNINLTVRRGETVGLIGKNGAGKSTLLKIITGVASPTTGNVKLHGRISSLLELGAGFNPEYTGIENIYLHGALLGMTREEIDVRRETILDFAEIGDFIHQPVKNYSSGMYVRLAFSVAINVDPDILIVDEALAVGDAKFQLKCLGEIERLKRCGKTILFVSHSIEMLKRFTDQAVLLHHGEILDQGLPEDVGRAYYRLLFGNQVSEGKQDAPKESVSLASEDEADLIVYPDRSKAYGNGGAVLDQILIRGLKEQRFFSPGDTLEFDMYWNLEPEKIREILLTHPVENFLMTGLRMENQQKIVITDFASTVLEKYVSINERRRCHVRYTIHIPELASGAYWFSPELAVGTQDVFVALCEYIYLFELQCLNRTMVFGIVKFNYDLDVL